MTLTKRDLVVRISEESNLTQERVQLVIQKTLDHIAEALAKGDEVVTAGGMLGKITKVADPYLTVEIANNTEIIVQKSAVQTILPKGTIKSLA